MNTTDSLATAWEVLKHFSHEAAEDDTGLAKYFVPPVAYPTLKRAGSSVLVGRFGSGKTALARRLADDSEIPAADRTEIYFRVDPLIAELRDASGQKDYPTLARALVYLRFIYDYAEKAQGKLIAKGEYAALTKELKALKLHPYQDLIGRIAGAVTNLAGSIKSLNFGDLFGFEMHDPPAEPPEPTVRRYRELVARIDTVARRLLTERPHLLVFDSVDPASHLLDETVGLISAMIGWLSQISKEGAQKFQFLVCLPFPVFNAFMKSATNLPNQEIFRDLTWQPDELRKIITERVELVVGADSEKWLARELGIDLDEAIRYTFGRPRDCIKLVRFCLETKTTNPTLSAEICWLKGVDRYSNSVLHFMGIEWNLNADGWEDVRSVLSQLNDTVDQKTLTEAIAEIRAAGVLKDRAVARIIDNFKALGLVSRVGNQFRIHPTLRRESAKDSLVAGNQPSQAEARQRQKRR